MTAEPLREWETALARALAARGTVLLIGPPDSGKSTFALALANAAVAAGITVAVVDADVGQAEFGPPGCIALARPTAATGSLSQLAPRALQFVGDINPAQHGLAVVLGTQVLARRGRERGAELVVVDTSGLVGGRVGERLKLSKVQALRPELIVHFRRPSGDERLARLLRTAAPGEVTDVARPRPGPAKSPLFRRARRERAWARAFENAAAHEISASQAAVVEAWPFTGTPLGARHLKFASDALGVEVIYGEENEEAVGLCTGGEPPAGGLDPIREQWGSRRILLTPAEWFQHLLIGLCGDEGRTLGIGLLQGINFSLGLLSVLTPMETVAQTRQVTFGRVRVRPDGSELDRLRPGDM